ncbi:TIGR03435 family protein [Terriglobus roseus]|uniref:Soil-associated protein, TIGR03435 family n=1 Tax=Terriglobus roseus TaxID=392734 RepID=A0A1G7FGG9_9BACT|nr:TIGR03435 family protein [Terriglobus roseus]SDE75016.1 soil-associated protein, TIGR03435 family [Terriglobus roseus]
MFEWMHPARKLLVVTMLVAPIAIAACGQTAASPTDAQRPSFDVASVRAHDPADRKNFNNFQAYPDGRFTSDNSSLWMLIHYAFQIQPYQFAGGPDWIKSVGYDLNAKPAEVHGFDDIPIMLQGVLEDRFQLKYHWETREQPVYDLVLVKPGKLKDSVVKGDCTFLPRPEGLPKDAACGDLQNHPGDTKGYKLTADELAASLSWLLSKSVINQTNLAGIYDVELRWTPESVAVRPEATSEQNAPDIFTAIQEQLGLRLQASKGPVRVFVIDHVEKPSDN